MEQLRQASDLVNRIAERREYVNSVLNSPNAKTTLDALNAAETEYMAALDTINKVCGKINEFEGLAHQYGLEVGRLRLPTLETFPEWSEAKAKLERYADDANYVMAELRKYLPNADDVLQTKLTELKDALRNTVILELTQLQSKPASALTDDERYRLAEILSGGDPFRWASAEQAASWGRREEAAQREHQIEKNIRRNQIN